MLTKYGTADNDILRSDIAATLYGLAGDDDLNGSAQRDFLYGGEGNDVLQGGLGHDVIDTGTGSYDRAKGGDGNDVITSSSTVSYLYGGSGRDVITATGNGYHYLSGDDGNDFLTGGSGDDWLEGGRGDDTLYGGSGQNRLFGGNGNDTLYGLDGYSQLDGGAGNDLLQSNIAHTTRMDGGAGFDTVQIDAADIWLDVTFSFEKKGADILVGDTAVARVKDVECFVFQAGHGNDSLSFTAANDTAWGNDGNDTLRGNTGDDTLYGGNGDDILSGGLGADILGGGAGADSFVFRTPGESQINPLMAAGANGIDHIVDFSSIEGDKIDLSGIDADTGILDNQAFSFIGSDAFTAIGQVRAFVNGSGDTVIEANNRDDLQADMVIILDHYSQQLNAADFIL
jgi:Ca2+-binding RTX toxin-like protein